MGEKGRIAVVIRDMEGCGLLLTVVGARDRGFDLVKIGLLKGGDQAEL